LKLENDAVLIATGTPIGHKLNINHQNVLAGIDFLKSVHLEKVTDVGKKVLVIGGGDVALDCARTAKRLNAEVIVMSLESYDEMRASEEEKIQSVEEDIIFKSGFAIDYVEGQTIHLKSCKSVLDEAFKFKPVYEKSDEQLIDINTVIFAIGQRRDVDFVDIKTSYNIDAHVFVAGDVIKPTIVIDAIAQGKTVAHLIDQTLVKEGLYIGDKIEIPEKVLNIRTFDDDLKEVRTTDKEKRVLSFDQVNQNYSVDEAKYEASRCMRCDRNSTASLLLGR
jgi:NADH-quinone oxidoreductase subunit F